MEVWVQDVWLYTLTAGGRPSYLATPRYSYSCQAFIVDWLVPSLILRLLLGEEQEPGYETS